MSHASAVANVQHTMAMTFAGDGLVPVIAKIPDLGVQIVSITCLESNLGSLDSVTKCLSFQDSIGVVSNDTSKQKETIFGVVEVVKQVLLPHLLNWDGRRKLGLLKVIHDALELHELTVSLQNTFGKSFVKAMNTDASLNKRGSTSSGGRLAGMGSPSNFPPVLDLALLSSLLRGGLRMPDAGRFVHHRCHCCNR